MLTVQKDAKSADNEPMRLIPPSSLVRVDIHVLMVLDKNYRGVAEMC
jgi:hypothetical protein